jgi:EmrB/QacA subfamily drug resistance transporter
VSPLQRRVLIVAILASLVSFLDASVVNVALPAISRAFGGGLTLQQWVVDAYLITLGALILTAGSLSDVFGRQRVLWWGLAGFGIASLLCAVAPSGVFLVVARGIQGIAGALLVPSSLALIISNFSGAAQAKAIGRWTAWTGIATIAGPVVGGILVDTLSWRYIFVVNVVPVALTLYLMRGLRPRDHGTGGGVDFLGAALGTVGLAGTVFALIEQSDFGWGSPVVWAPFVVGVLSLAAFFVAERTVSAPMLPLRIFRVHNFWVGNISTALVYGALGFAPLTLTLFLQEVAGYSAVVAGLVLIPSTLAVVSLAGYFGGLAGRFGPRLFMSVGPLVAASAFAWLLSVSSPRVDYLVQVLPASLLFGIGMAMTVAPLTSAILGAIEPEEAGIASAVNNAVARIAGLIAVAALAVIVGGALDVSGFHRALYAAIALFGAGAVVSAIGIRNPLRPRLGDPRTRA